MRRSTIPSTSKTSFRSDRSTAAPASRLRFLCPVHKEGACKPAKAAAAQMVAQQGARAAERQLAESKLRPPQKESRGTLAILPQLLVQCCVRGSMPHIQGKANAGGVRAPQKLLCAYR
mmetsp:Transcript_24995/g.80794  ORF Transcript_24995/g.80794 Transcript_24995/m.80794 type:complete len:118 (+) Transcript_24995:378-731(+)|eukprot:scaffold13708_cov116-Isochrysis_galbana.AAC.9